MNVIRDEDFEEALNNTFINRDFHHISVDKSRGKVFRNDETTRRERERKMREQLQSRHGPTAETHDQVNSASHIFGRKFI